MRLPRFARVLLGQGGPPPTVPWQQDQPAKPIPVDEALERFRARTTEEPPQD